VRAIVSRISRDREILLFAKKIVRGEIPNIRIMYNDIEHSISIDFYIYISIFQVFKSIY
jgi:hypothetical protein